MEENYKRSYYTCHWQFKLIEEVEEKSSLKYLDTSYFIKEKKIRHHNVWNLKNESSHTVKKAVVKAQLLTGTFILQSSRAKFNSLVSSICPLCHNGEEDVVHFISAWRQQMILEIV